MTKFILVWFAVSSHGIYQIEGIPHKEFNTAAECKEFAASRVGTVKSDGRKVVYECNKVPTQESK